jgi:hypothetical protein
MQKIYSSADVEPAVDYTYPTTLHHPKDFLNSTGVRLVFVLNSRLKDCECSKPNS